MNNKDIVKFNELLVELGNLGINKGKQNEAVELFRNNREFIWDVLYNIPVEKIANELDKVVLNELLIRSILQIFIVVTFEAVIRDEEKNNV